MGDGSELLRRHCRRLEEWVCCAGTLFGRLIITSCGHLRSLQDVSDEPDICDDTYLLAGRGLSYCPSILLTPRLLPTLLDSAIAGILVQHS